MATLAAIAEGTPGHLESNVFHAGGDLYWVRLFDNGNTRWQPVFFDGTWTSRDAEPSRRRGSDGNFTGAMTGDFWPTLYVRAYLDYLNINREDHSNDWIAGSPAWARAFRAGSMFTGWTDSNDSRLDNHFGSDEDFLFETIFAGMANGDILSTGGSGHLLAITDLYFADGNWKVRLYDPRGRDNNMRNSSGLRDPDTGINDGRVVLTWENFLEAFVYMEATYSEMVPIRERMLNLGWRGGQPLFLGIVVRGTVTRLGSILLALLSLFIVVSVF
jgi:hypothetical protein